MSSGKERKITHGFEWEDMLQNLRVRSGKVAGMVSSKTRTSNRPPRPEVRTCPPQPTSSRS